MSERAFLAAALRAHVRRRRALGELRTARAEAQAPSRGDRRGAAPVTVPPTEIAPERPAEATRASTQAASGKGLTAQDRPAAPAAPTGPAAPLSPAASAGGPEGITPVATPPGSPQVEEAPKAAAEASPRRDPRPAAPAPEDQAPIPAQTEAAVEAPAPAQLPAPAPAEAPTPPAPALPAALAPGCADLGALREAVAGCRACGLCETRTQTVFADGTGRARVMFIGEAPGFHEDSQGVPFVGKAGALLTDIIVKGMGLAREDVFIANVLKCRPPDNRDPQADEKALCTPWLDRQIELVDPLVLIPLGRHAANHVLGTDTSMGRLRGRVHEAKGRRVVPTYHPAYLLRNPADKRRAWEDIQLAMGILGLDRPGR